ncbi:unnamed protein product [Lactuca saligna]|uniref:Uncharacterized protein n=1 Tax=Lactuca saligna TaxID=75948 RepID=A0AA35ZNM7_LACSI|nr:unnamed protein product [Lactuca saligna]
MQMLDIDYDLIFGLSDHAGNAEEKAPDNHISELSKLTDGSTSPPQEIGESMQNDLMEGEHLDSNTLTEGEHSFEGENERQNADVEGERLNANDEEELLQNNENYHDVNDVCSIAGSDNDELEKEKKTKRSKKVVVESSKKCVKESTSTKSLKKVPISEAEPIQPEVVVADTPSTQKEIIPSKTSVFRKIKMKSKHKSRSPLTNVVRKPQVSHQGVIFHEIPAPASPSSKKIRAYRHGQTHIEEEEEEER